MDCQNSGQQVLHELTSHSQKNVEFTACASSLRSYSSDSESLQSYNQHPLVLPQAHRTYSNFSQNAFSHHPSHSMQPTAPKYSEPLDDEAEPNRRLSVEYAHVDDPRVDPHPHLSSHERVHLIHRYPSSSENSRYPFDYDTRPPLNIESLPIDDHQSSRSPLNHYRATLRRHHGQQSSSLQNISQDGHDYSPLPDRARYAYSQPQTMSYASSRRISDSTDIPHIDPPPDDTQDSNAAHRLASMRSMHFASSIPMSNNPPRHTHHSHYPHHDLEQSHQHLQLDEHARSRHHDHQSRRENLVSGGVIPPISYFHSSSSGRRDSSELTLPSITHPLNLRPTHPPRSRSPPDPHINRYHPSTSSSSYRIPSYPRHTRSPLPISDHETAFGSDAAAVARDEADFDRELDPPPRFSVPGQEDGQMLSRTTSTRPLGEVALGRRSDPGGVPEDPTKAKTIKKKKKSKMHACEICQKKFPRPSGLKTHMNTHSNEKPYACGFPGCTRTFGVRSNARRHLRTHGVIPGPSRPPAPSKAPYVVGFETLTIMPPQNTGRGTQDPDLYRAGVDEEGRSVDDIQRSEERYAPTTRVPTYKVRWMPLSVDTRTDPRAVDGSARMDTTQDQDSIRKGKDRWHGDEARGYYDEVEETIRSARPRMEMVDDEREGNQDDLIYGNRALVPRLSLPLRLMPSSHSSSLPSLGGAASTSGSTMMISSIVDDDPASQFSLTGRPVLHSPSPYASSRTAAPICRCSPPCPGDSSGVVDCRVFGPIYPASISPSMSAHSFATPSPSTSASPINLPDGYGSASRYESFPSTHDGNTQTAASRYEYRIPHTQTGPRPFHSSQVNMSFL